MTKGRTLTDSAEIVALAEFILDAPKEALLGWDTETGATDELRDVFPKAELHPYVSAYCTGISVCLAMPDDVELEGFYVPVAHKWGNAHPQAVQRLLYAIQQSEALNVMHHAVFDWAIANQLGDSGFEPNERCIDTQVVSWLADENQGKRLKEDLGDTWLDYDASEEKRVLEAARAAPYKLPDARRAVLTAFPELGAQLKNGGLSTARLAEEGERLAKRLATGRSWGQLTVQEMGPYASQDAVLPIEVAEAMLGGTGALRHPQQALRREMDLQGVLYRMSRRGASASVEGLDNAATLYERRAEVIGERLDEELGLKNPTSSKQVARVLYGKLGLPVMGLTKSKAPATDKNALEMLQGHPVANAILEYRKWDHAASVATSFANHARFSFDGRIHGHYSSTQTVTGRLSASGPNVMTIPREDSLPEIRQAFYEVPKGIERIGFDLASAELWVTAALTADPVLTETLMGGENLHVRTMLAVFGGEPDKERREYTLSKNVNFGIEYGAGIDQITIFAAKAGYSPREARAVAKKMRDGHIEAYRTQHRVARFLANKAKELGQLPIPCAPGRYRHFRSPGRWAVPYYTALNALVQGGVAEFMKNTMLELDKSWARDFLILQVHDELAFDVPAGEGMTEKLLSLLTEIAGSVPHFKYPMKWAPKKWSLDG